MDIPFGVQSYQHRSKPLSSQSLVNCYLEQAPQQARTPVAVVMAYGIDEFAQGLAGTCRGALVRNGVCYAVIGTSLVTISSGGVVVSLGSIGGAGPVDIAGDETNLMIVTGSTDYAYDGSTVAAITDADYPGADWVAYLDGYFIVSRNGQFYISGNRNPRTWEALDFASAEKHPDNIVDGTVDHSELILFGVESGEIWHNTGEADFPISKSESGDFEIGIYCKGAHCRTDNTVFFLGHDGVFYRLEGYTPVRVSTHAIEQAVEDAEDKSFRCLSWKEGGHTFVSVGSTDFTFVYDVATQLWHQRKSYGYDYWRANFIVRCYNKWLVGDSLSAKVGALDPRTFTEFGDVLRCSAVSPAIANGNKKLRHSKLQLVFETGVGLVSGQGSNPQVMIRWSNNGGRTWSNEKWRSIGAIGEYQQGVQINRVGQAKDRIYEYAISDPVPRTLISASVEVQ